MIIVFDNYNSNNCCRSLWGFSAYFEEYKLLFDTGSNGRVLLKNMQELGVNVKTIEYLFITHSHWDHIGGVDSILEVNPNITLFVPSSLSKHLINDLKSLAKEVIICTKKPQKLFANLYTTGLLGTEMPEQSLIIDEDETKVITGCGHFGIQNIVKVAQKVIDKKIDFAIGGFHLLRSSDDEIVNSIDSLKALGVRKVLPTHCTGDRAIKMYAESFKENSLLGGIGIKI
ncbi:MAG: MBL fold metallo-hydrolase [Campylobacterota bacterium]|nr:MBL fold metallo-hydrolase [Campylobacterota bacterium]